MESVGGFGRRRLCVPNQYCIQVVHVCGHVHACSAKEAILLDDGGSTIKNHETGKFETQCYGSERRMYQGGINLKYFK